MRPSCHSLEILTRCPVSVFFLDNLKHLGTFTAQCIVRLSLYEPAMVFRA